MPCDELIKHTRGFSNMTQLLHKRTTKTWTWTQDRDNQRLLIKGAVTLWLRRWINNSAWFDSTW